MKDDAVKDPAAKQTEDIEQRKILRFTMGNIARDMGILLICFEEPA